MLIIEVYVNTSEKNNCLRFAINVIIRRDSDSDSVVVLLEAIARSWQNRKSV